MDSKSKNLAPIKNLLSQRDYSPRTINSYVSALKRLFDFYANVPPDEISFKQISDYITYLFNRKKSAHATIRIHLTAYNLYYNEILRKNYAVRSLHRKSVSNKIPTILSPDEIIRLLQSVLNNVKHHSILSLIYSAGLDASQVSLLRIEDVDLQNKRLKVRNSKGNIIRNAIIANQLVADLQYYLTIYSPEKWFFEGREKGTPFSTANLRQIFKSALRSAKIDKKVSVRSLRYSYVKHLELYGIALPNILQEIGIFSPGTMYSYSQMGLIKTNLSFSPLDRISNEYSNAHVDTSSLEKSFNSIQNIDEKSYLLEALKCLNSKAPRAAVIFSWIAAIRNIQYRCLHCEQVLLNNAIKKYFKNAPMVKNIDDFEKIKERTVLEASHTVGIFNKREKNVLIGCLDLRNQCGHSGTYMPDELRVGAFLEDLYQIVFSKPLPLKDDELEVVEENDDFEAKYEDDGLPF